MANIVPADLGPFPKLNPEFVVQAQPDIVMAAQRELAQMAARPGWSRLRALRQHRTCGFADAQYELLIRPGPRIGEAAQLLADCLVALRALKAGDAPIARRRRSLALGPAAAEPGAAARRAGRRQRGLVAARRCCDARRARRRADRRPDPRAAHARRLAHRRAARTVRRDRAGPVPQSAGRPVPARLGVGRVARRRAGAGRRRAGRPRARLAPADGARAPRAGRRRLRRRADRRAADAGCWRAARSRRRGCCWPASSSASCSRRSAIS